MKKIYTHIWEKALPYQDKRDDAGHAFITLEFAKQLVDLEQGKADVILPAIILHDTGWSQLSRAEWLVVFDTDSTPEQEMVVRLRHQEESVKIAQRVLQEMEYPSIQTVEILEIIAEHDTRQGFISKNEGLVRDADKLWRFSKTGFDADVERFKFDPHFLHDKIHNQIDRDGFFSCDTSRELATLELERRKREFTNAALTHPKDSTYAQAG
ncbi:HD domain-containing protein [Pseudodesulfovibrio sp. JC047]|uniref:HD domain-containing protein n=1 Tax=Pseudodesulfovibrio sp. JC047 TaxID=2683199 RepID=UPI0013D8BCC4|nr:HD domain-containing protein [Pseudodesulfovibrio sp. JC047]NDV19033.1 HD domain-containing protein [Pseudodesulfovibrio sp. JC047]